MAAVFSFRWGVCRPTSCGGGWGWGAGVLHPRAAHLTAQGGMGGAQSGAAGVMHAGRK